MNVEIGRQNIIRNAVSFLGNQKRKDAPAVCPLPGELTNFLQLTTPFRGTTWLVFLG
jgi:hypothetical protein